jgi:biotin-independent malonate decarboxylase gamma subunit
MPSAGLGGGLESVINFYGRGRDAIELIVDEGSFEENVCGGEKIDPEFAESALVGTATISGEIVTVIANDAGFANPHFRMVYAGLMGLEEGLKMAYAVYLTIKADKDKPLAEKRPIILVVDTPGMSPGKVEEIIGIYKSTGAYQLASAEARRLGHPIVAMVIGRAISGGFLCHGLQADRILALSDMFGTMIHVMPLIGIARVTKINIMLLEELAESNPVFAAGVSHFYNLGGVDGIVEEVEDMRASIETQITEIRRLKAGGEHDKVGPWSRLMSGIRRGGRKTSEKVIELMEEEFEKALPCWLGGEDDEPTP